MFIFRGTFANYLKGSERGISIDADSGPLGYLLWCCGNRSWLWPYCDTYSCKPRYNTTLEAPSFDKNFIVQRIVSVWVFPFQTVQKPGSIFVNGTTTLFPLGKVFHNFSFMFSISDCQICSRNSKLQNLNLKKLVIFLSWWGSLFCLIYNNNSP